MPTYTCTDGNGSIEIQADSPRAAAREFVDTGSWGDIDETTWIDVYVEIYRDAEQETKLVDALRAIGVEIVAQNDGTYSIVGGYDEVQAVVDVLPPGWKRDGNIVWIGGDRDSFKVRLDPPEPACADGKAHDWQAPHEIVGGIEDNPGVWGNGGGVIINEVCMRCGCARIINTWAQDRSDGTQGLRSTRYEPGKYSEAIHEVEGA